MTNRDNITSTSWVDFGKLPADIAFSPEEFDELWNTHPPQLGKIKIFSKEIETPRYQQSYLQDYIFSGLKHNADLDIHPTVIRLFKWVNGTLGYGIFNQVFINWYEDGEHYIGPHFDKEKQLVKGSPIFSCSLGATRTFELSDPNTKKVIKSYKMENNTYLVMGGDLQKTYKHGVPKITPSSLAKKIGRRINITFRIFTTNISPDIKQKLDNIQISKSNEDNNKDSSQVILSPPTPLPKKILIKKINTPNM